MRIISVYPSHAQHMHARRSGCAVRRSGPPRKQARACPLHALILCPPEGLPPRRRGWDVTPRGRTPPSSILVAKLSSRRTQKKRRAHRMPYDHWPHSPFYSPLSPPRRSARLLESERPEEAPWARSCIYSAGNGRVRRFLFCILRCAFEEGRGENVRFGGKRGVKGRWPIGGGKKGRGI